MLGILHAIITKLEGSYNSQPECVQLNETALNDYSTENNGSKRTKGMRWIAYIVRKAHGMHGGTMMYFVHNVVGRPVICC